jgi:hypothetical protein
VSRQVRIGRRFAAELVEEAVESILSRGDMAVPHWQD